MDTLSLDDLKDSSRDSCLVKLYYLNFNLGAINLYLKKILSGKCADPHMEYYAATLKRNGGWGSFCADMESYPRDQE